MNAEDAAGAALGRERSAEAAGWAGTVPSGGESGRANAPLRGTARPRRPSAGPAPGPCAQAALIAPGAPTAGPAAPAWTATGPADALWAASASIKDRRLRQALGNLMK